MISTLIFFMWSVNAQAQDLPAVPSDAPTKLNSFTNEMRNSALNRLNATSIKIIKETEGLLVVDTRGKTVAPGSQLMFMRFHDGEPEVLARGKVEAATGPTALVALDRNGITKRPGPGDFAISIGTAWTPPTEKIKDPPPQFVYTEPAPKPGDLGYIQLDYSRYSHELVSKGSNLANFYKNAPSASFSGLHFLWFIEPIWRFGIEYESMSGQYPTSTYFREAGASTEEWSKFALHVRSRAVMNGYFRPSIKAYSFNHSFTTINKDEDLLSSTYSGLGLAAIMNFEIVGPVWKPEKGSGVRLQAITAELGYAPTVDAKDLHASRGTGSPGSNAQEWKISATGIAYLDFVPFFKRWIVEAEYGSRAYQLSFSGAATNPNGNYPIPDGGNFNETRTYTQFKIGVRFDDFIGQFISPR